MGIVTSGLTFYYDMYNASSYRGPPHTNLPSNINDFSAATWTKTNCTATYNPNIRIPGPSSFNGFVWEINESVITNVSHYVSFNQVTSIGQVYTFSVCAKAKERSQIWMSLSEGLAVFDLLTGRVIQPASNTCLMTDLGNGWYRCSITATKTNATPGAFVGPWLNGTGTYIGVVGRGFYLCKAQLELNSYVTPWGPTRTTTTNLYDIVSGNPITTALTYSSDNTFSFNGTSNYMDAGNATGLQQSTAITMEAWVLPTAITATGNIMSKNGNTGYRFRIDNSKTIQFLVDGANNVLIGPEAVAGVWQHIAVTGNSGGLKIYRNGILVASNAIPYAPSAPTGGTLVIGGFTAGSELFTGNIATGSMYSRALTSGEILQNFSALRGRFGI